LLGFFVYHTSLKIGKIIGTDFAKVAVYFYQVAEMRLFEKSAFANNELSRFYLPLETRCHASGNPCKVDQIADPIRERQPVTYLVTTDDGFSLRVTEVDLVPVEILREDPVTSLVGLQQEGYPLFSTRSELMTAYAELLRQGGGVTALLSSRIDIRPHQSFVAGMILQDRLRRYILADEVGLGKTVETGVVVQDLLSARPGAHVLVLCPGALTQQWFCEFYTKFSTRVFTLLDLHPDPNLLSPENRRTVIAPLHAVDGPHRKWLEETDWDMVVVDEVHHLLVSDKVYLFVKALSARAPSILLLSALPAQQRKTEFLKLLALLEPDRYANSLPEEFERLYDAQPEISRHLRRLRRRLEEEKPDPADIRDVIRQIIAIPALRGDVTLQTHANNIASSDSKLIQNTWNFLRLTAEHARINRRILRNRRARLVDDGLIDKTTRVYLPAPYDPGQPELDAVQAALRLMRSAEKHLDQILWSAFGRVLMQSYAHPETATQLMTRLDGIIGTSFDSLPEPLGHLAGNSGWDRYQAELLAAVRPHLAPLDLEEALDAVHLWRNSTSALNRVDGLVDLLKRLGLKYKKLVVFAGFPGMVEQLLPVLREVFEPESVCEFHSDMDRKDKEENVIRFRTDPDALLLICDESGGEGRNFQFAGCLVHFDTPWYVSRVEQRIGRLDRLGRVATEVPTCVQFARGTPEEDVVRCFAEGFRVYGQSVSGLEFALRDLEVDVVRFVLGTGERSTDEFISELSAEVEQERVREENEAVLDEVSFNREAAERYRRGHTLSEAEESLEKAFTEFLRKVATGDSALPRFDREFPSGIWQLDPTQFQHIKVEDPAPATPGQPRASFRGTFRRRIAQERLDLQFFSVGHPLFDGVMNAVWTQQCGRVYAIDVTLPGQPVWHGFEFVFVAGPDLQSLGGNRGLISQALRVFTVPPLHVFVDCKGILTANGDHLLKLRRGLNHGDKDRTWWNLTKQKAARATLPVGGQDQWRRAVPLAYSTALSEAKRRFQDRLEPDVAAEVELLAEQARQAIESDVAESACLERLQRAVRGWIVSVDSAGFLSINGELGRAR
jgi:ATP-dependent helicase HepA